MQINLRLRFQAPTVLYGDTLLWHTATAGRVGGDGIGVADPKAVFLGLMANLDARVLAAKRAEASCAKDSNGDGNCEGNDPESDHLQCAEETRAIVAEGDGISDGMQRAATGLTSAALRQQPSSGNSSVWPLPWLAAVAAP